MVLQAKNNNNDYKQFKSQEAKQARPALHTHIIMCMLKWRWQCVKWEAFGDKNINPFTAPDCKISRLNDAQTHLQMYIFCSYNTSAFSAMRFDENPFKCQCEKDDEKA